MAARKEKDAWKRMNEKSKEKLEEIDQKLGINKRLKPALQTKKLTKRNYNEDVATLNRYTTRFHCLDLTAFWKSIRY